MLHEGELDVSEDIVRALIATQFPEWSGLRLSRVPSSGTVNVLYRMGDDLVVRLPRLESFASGLETAAIWLPKLAPLVPLEIPECVALGRPNETYPSTWMVMRWIDGENATATSLTDLEAAARSLGDFVLAPRSAGADGAPHGGYRALGLSGRDADTREAIDKLGGELDRGELIAAWELAAAVPEWDGSPTWFHGDLHSGNLLARNGELCAVIDFEVCGVGDPSSDLMAGWWLFDRESREVFKDTVSADAASLRRGRGWALTIAVVALPYYKGSNPKFANMARRAIREVLSDI